MKLLILAFLLVGCAARPYETIDPDLMPAYESFIAASVANNHDLSGTNNLIIEYGDAQEACNNPGATGCCIKSDIKTPRIVIAPSVKELIETDKEIVLFHELGHCLLNRDHEPTMDSLMFAVPSAISVYMFTSNKAAYLKELFKK